MTLSPVEGQALVAFIDRHDAVQGNNRADHIEPDRITDGFLEDFRRTFVGDNQRVDTRFLHEIGRRLSDRMNLRGAESFFNGLFDHCPAGFNSVLCRQPGHSSVPLATVPVLQSPYADRFKEAVQRIKDVDPDLARDLELLSKNGRIVYTEATYGAYALVDPRTRRIILTKNLFTKSLDVERFDPSTNFDTEQIIELIRILGGGPQAQPSMAGMEFHEWARLEGLEINLVPEEYLVHEREHLQQMDVANSRNGYSGDSTAKHEPGYYYDLLTYMRLFAFALDKKGLTPETHNLSGVDENRCSAEGLATIAEDMYRQTESEAKEAGGKIVERIAERIKTTQR